MADLPDWGTFWAGVSASSGVIVLLLVDLLVRIWPALSEELTRAKKYLVLIGAIIIPLIVAQIVAVVPQPDPVVWQIMLITGTYAVHEWLYRFLQKPIVAKLAARAPGAQTDPPAPPDAPPII